MPSDWVRRSTNVDGADRREFLQGVTGWQGPRTGTIVWAVALAHTLRRGLSPVKKSNDSR